MFTESQAYQLHIAVARMIANKYYKSLNLNPSDIARYALAVNKKENRQFNPKAKNPNSSARGMMQMLIGTQKELETKYLKIAHKPDAIYNPQHAVFLGQYELVRQLKRYKGDWKKAIHAYNRGSYLPKNRKSYTAGELYTNSVLSFMNKIDFSQLEKETAIAAFTDYKPYKEWS